MRRLEEIMGLRNEATSILIVERKVRGPGKSCRSGIEDAIGGRKGECIVRGYGAS